MTSGAAKHENRLIHETSPYLLQHAHNPVDWYPWGPEALERAKAEDKPILLSIGYAACHWCHVMERESFESEAIARLMNDNFVCVKVDREERPDLDDIYMTATVAMNGSGGWPMTVFLTPEQEPFFAGTYFPPADKHGRPGFSSLLQQIAKLWQGQRSELLEQAAELTNHVRVQSAKLSPLDVKSDAIRNAVATLAANFDAEWGGFGSAPKFPPAASLSLLLRQYAESHDADALNMVTRTLDAMKNGGIYDHVGGGFARYSTDERWLVPHFEKMLYDNAQLASVYLEAWQVTQDPEYARVARETLDYVLREMEAPAGGYYSATDADSEGEEGKFFVWSVDQISEILEPDAAERFCLYYDITPGGNWEGHSIANTPHPPEEIARQLGISVAELMSSIEDSKRQVYSARQQRVPPLLDDKLLVSWNALMIAAMAEGRRVLGDERYLVSAQRAADNLLTNLRRPDGGLFRTARAGKAHLDGYLEDYAFLADALVTLYEAGGGFRYLAEARALAERMLADFGDPESGAFFSTAHGHESLIVRTREGHDGAIPSANALAARALSRLAVHFDHELFRVAAEQAIVAHGRAIERAPRAFVSSLLVLRFLLKGPVELVLAGSPAEAGQQRFVSELARFYLPDRVIAYVDPAAPEPLERALTLGKQLVKGEPALYICKNFSCAAPLTDPREVAAALADSQGEQAPSVLGHGPVSGYATREGSERYAARHRLSDFNRLAKLELLANRFGFGGYRVDDGAAEHRAALVKALKSGINLIDTSTNYASGRSERLIGQVLAALVHEGELGRDEVVVVSKIGYVQGDNLELAQQREKEGRPFPEMVKFAEGAWHCMHPDWIADQLTRSLDRLGLEVLDVCLVHNPEYFLSDAAKRREERLDGNRAEFYRRLQQAFGALEAEVQKGRIRSYGVSSNTCIDAADDPEATELRRMLECARAAGGDAHHFRILQLPFNLIESGAALIKNNSAGSETVLEHAQANGIAVLVNRPLNAILERGLLRLADPPIFSGAPPFDIALSAVERMESEFKRAIAPLLETAPGSPPASELFDWARQLKAVPAQVESLEQWRDIERQVIMPRLIQVFSALSRALSGELEQKFIEWRKRYVASLEQLMLALAQKAAGQNQRQIGALRGALAPELEEPLRDEPFSRLALAILSATPGVSCVLVGMRRPEYVADVLAASALPAPSNSAALLRAVASNG